MCLRQLDCISKTLWKPIKQPLEIAGNCFNHWINVTCEKVAKNGPDLKKLAPKKSIWQKWWRKKKRPSAKPVIPSFPSSLVTLQVPGPTESQPAQHEKSLGFTYIWLALPNLKWNLRELLFERYQIGRFSHNGLEGIPETYCFRKEAVFVKVYLPLYNLGPSFESLKVGICRNFSDWREHVRVEVGVRYLFAGMSTRPCTILKNIINWFLGLASSVPILGDPALMSHCLYYDTCRWRTCALFAGPSQSAEYTPGCGDSMQWNSIPDEVIPWKGKR